MQRDRSCGWTTAKDGQPTSRRVIYQFSTRVAELKRLGATEAAGQDGVETDFGAGEGVVEVVGIQKEMSISLHHPESPYLMNAWMEADQFEQLDSANARLVREAVEYFVDLLRDDELHSPMSRFTCSKVTKRPSAKAASERVFISRR